MSLMQFSLSSVNQSHFRQQNNLTNHDKEFSSAELVNIQEGTSREFANDNCCIFCLDMAEQADPARATKRRRLNFVEEEIFVLIREVTERRNVIHGRLETTLTKQKKKQAWLDITSAVNAVSNTVRNVEEIRRKYVNFRSAVKKKLSAVKLALKA